MRMQADGRTSKLIYITRADGVAGISALIYSGTNIILQIDWGNIWLWTTGMIAEDAHYRVEFLSGSVSVSCDTAGSAGCALRDLM